MASPIDEPDRISVHTTLSEIRSGTLDAGTLSKSVRQLCVEALFLEGHTSSSLAQLFKVSDKTIRRDLQDIYEKNALNPSADLARELIGECLQKARAHHAYLMRMARGKDGSLQEKAQAEYLAWRTLKETMSLMQSLGYLPQAPTTIVGDIFHHTEKNNDLSFEEIKKKIADMEALAREYGEPSSEVTAQIEQLKVKLQKAEIHHEVLRISQPKKEDSK